MSIDERIRSALLTLNYPVENAVYQSDSKTYFTFSYMTIPSDFGDDHPSHEVIIATAHLFAPLNVNVTSIVKRAKRVLFAAGFTWPQTLNNSDENGRDIVFEFEDAEGVDLYGDSES